MSFNQMHLWEVATPLCHGCAVPPPLKGRLWTVQSKKAPLEGETGEAPPVAGKASRFRGSGAIGGPARDRESPYRDGVAVSEAD